MTWTKYLQKIDKTEITFKGIGTKGTGKGRDREIMTQKVRANFEHKNSRRAGKRKCLQEERKENRGQQGRMVKIS